MSQTTISKLSRAQVLLETITAATKTYTEVDHKDCKLIAAVEGDSNLGGIAPLFGKHFLGEVEAHTIDRELTKVVQRLCAERIARCDKELAELGIVLDDVLLDDYQLDNEMELN